MKRFSEFFFGLVLSLFKESWKSKGKTKVLIQLNPVFTRSKWIELISSSLSPKFIGQIEFIFTKSRFGYIKNFRNSNFCFQLGSGKRLTQYSGKYIYYPLRGHDSISSDFKRNNKILSPNLSVVNKAIAEYCLAMVIVGGRNLHRVIGSSRNKKWNQAPAFESVYRELQSLKIGVLGFGAVGKEVIRIFQKNGAIISCCSRSLKISDNTDLDYYAINRLESFINSIDVLIITVSLNDETREMFSRDILNKLSAKMIINVSRGEVFSETDFLSWLRDNPEVLAILDVFASEPLPRNSEFYNLENCIVTPHIAGNIGLFREEIMQDFLGRLHDFLTKSSSFKH